MDGWAEAALAWKLVDSISPSLTAAERAQLYAAIGSGESYSAITAALRALVRDALPLPAWLRTRSIPRAPERACWRSPRTLELAHGGAGRRRWCSVSVADSNGKWRN